MNDANAELSHALLFEAGKIQPCSKKINEYLTCGADINHQLEFNGFTPLMLAVERDDEQLVSYFLEQGAHPLIKNNNREIASDIALLNTPSYKTLKNYELLFSVMMNDLPSVKLIIDAGGLVNFQGAGDYSALMIATEQNHIDLVDYLLKSGADLLLERIDGVNVFDLTTDPLINQLLHVTKKLDEAAKEHERLDLKRNGPFFFL